MKDRDSFIVEARAVHGGKYSYDLVVYENRRDKVIITCPEHGNFEQSPASHVRGARCPVCAKSRFIKAKKTTDSFIDELKDMHRNLGYDYSKVVYVNCSTKVAISCPKHGQFHATPTRLLGGQKCPVCAEDNRGTRRLVQLETVLERAKQLHKDRYDYSLITDYMGMKQIVPIRCKAHDYVFKVSMNNHINCGYGCSKCAKTRR
jgi:hypothetical protein